MERYRTPVLLGLLLLIGLGAVSLLLRGGPGEPISIELPTPTPAPPKDLKVYITGSVNRPGVYTLTQGDRVETAIKAAGGPTQEADLERINLAAWVRDAQQIHIPKLGETLSSSFSPAMQQKINLNTASKEFLNSLPGIGETRAQRIIESRSKEPFKDPEDLVSRKIVPRSVFEQFKDMVTVY